MADKLGQPFMPWQRLVADVGCEIDLATGLPAYREVRVTIPRQSGKALDCSTPILTANRGWTSMGEIRLGDEVYHPGGHHTRVTFVSDVESGHECFQVTTVDGRSLVADADHLWSVVDKRRQKGRGRDAWFEQRIVPTREMFEGGLSRYASGGRTSRTDGKSYSTNEYRWVLPTQEPLKSPDIPLPVDPYLFGAWLGDGTSSAAEITCHIDEIEHWCSAIFAAGFFPSAHQGGGTPDTWKLGITCQVGPGRHQRSFAGRLRALDVLNNKHVPDLYLSAGTDQRAALLQGMLDTDGCIDNAGGQVEFCSMNPRLADAALFLARSLGWRATLRTGRAMLSGRDYGIKYRVCFTPKRSDPFGPFRIDRKAARVQAKDGGKGRATLSVISIEPVDSVPVRCIKVESPDGLFLAGRDLMPTHNTTLFLSWQINRCVSRRWPHPQRSAFTAQTGKDARDKWIDELFPLIRNSQLKTLVAGSIGGRLAINEGMGNESIRFKTGSIIRLLSTATTSGHSKTLHQAVMDEVWHDTDDRREQGLRPAMITVRDAQLLVCSTAGTETSVVLNRKVETGREAVDLDTGHGVAYFEWSAPDDWSPDDEAAYFTFSPALCPDPPCRCAGPGENWRHTITLEALRAERDAMERAEFMRAYGNIASGQKNMRWLVIPEADWTTAADESSMPIDPVAFAVTLSSDRQWATICVAGARADGLRHVEVADRRQGTGWVVERLKDLVAKWKPCAVVIDAGGPAGSLVAEAEEAGIELTKPTARDVAAAAGAFYDGISGVPAVDPETGEMGRDPRIIRHRGQPELTAAVAAALKRPLSAAWAWDQIAASGDITPVIGASNALWGYATRAPVIEQPFFGTYR